MSTVIRCEVDGISNPLELEGGLSFGYSSSADVTNPGNNKRITFGPVIISPFSFAIRNPDKDAVKALIKWLVAHEVKQNVTFKISEQEMDANSRDLVLKQVVLEAYNESISEYGVQISLTVVGQIVNIDTIEVDMTAQR